MDSTNQIILLYDGECGFCNASVQFIIRHERRKKSMLFAPLQGTTARAILHRNPQLQAIDSLIVVKNYGTNAEKLYWYSSGVLEICGYLGGMFTIARYVGSIIPAFIADKAYKYIASIRKRIIAQGNDVCLLLPPEVQKRFLP